MSYFYSSATGTTYSSDQVKSLFGINTETTDTEVLNVARLYPVQDSSPLFDVTLFIPAFTWSIVALPGGGEGAERTFTGTDRPLADAKAAGIRTLKARAEEATQAKFIEHELSAALLAVIATFDESNLPAAFATFVSEVQSIASTLSTDIIAVNAATTVTDIDNIVNP